VTSGYTVDFEWVTVLQKCVEVVGESVEIQERVKNGGGISEKWILTDSPRLSLILLDFD